MPINIEKLNSLAGNKSIIDTYDDANTPYGSTKLGEGLSNIVVGKDSIQSNLPIPGNPGFSFSANSSKINLGKKLDFDGDFKRIFFQGGGQQFNPLGNTKASSTSDPLPTILPSLRPETLGLLAPDFQKALDNIMKLGSIV